MKLLEYEAKSILKNSRIPVPAGQVSDGSDNSQPTLPVVVKSQVPIGGRGKAGGIKIAKTNAELVRATQDILSLAIKGFTPHVVLYEELLEIGRELYLSLTINRSKAAIELIAHRDGGVEIEAHDPDEFFRTLLTGTGFDGTGDTLADYYDLPEKSFAISDLLEKLYHCFITSDATLLEINPLILTKDGRLIAGDCKMIVDDAAAFRHPEWNFEDKPANSNFVTLNPEGTVATIANGAGLAMATVDAVTTANLMPANFLDIGGNATVSKIVESFERIGEFPNITAIVINIFGGIVRCDDVAQAIIEAKSTMPRLPALYVRLSGNRSEEAAELLARSGLKLYTSLEACIQELHA
jgi:succinyl-CoA synthetase beta subunit